MLQPRTASQPPTDRANRRQWLRWASGVGVAAGAGLLAWPESSFVGPAGAGFCGGPADE